MVNKITFFAVKYFKYALLVPLGWIFIHLFSVLGPFAVILYFSYVSFVWLGFFRQNFQRKPFLGVVIVFLIYLFSLSFVWFEGLLLKDFGYPKLPKTAVFEVSQKGEYLLGEVFPFEIKIVDIEMPVNVVQADISFDSEAVEIVDISTENSFANVFIQKEIDNGLGFARFSGGLPNPGFGEKEGIFSTVYFVGKKPGITTVKLLPSSKVLANDGKGTNILKEVPSVNVLILPDKTDELQAVQVLGESSSGTKMIFYEEQERDNSIEQQEEEEEFSIVDSSLDFVARYDNYVISFWLRVLERAFRL